VPETQRAANGTPSASARQTQMFATNGSAARHAHRSARVLVRARAHVKSPGTTAAVQEMSPCSQNLSAHAGAYQAIAAGRHGRAGGAVSSPLQRQ